MKKVTWICVFLFCACNVFAQKLESGSLACLAVENQLNIVLDFSQCRIDGLTEDDFIWKMSMKDSRGEDWGNYWKNECYRDFLSKFCIHAFEETKNTGFRFGSFPEAKYTAVLQLQTVDDDGEIDGEIRVRENETGKEMAVIKKIHGEGGRCGSIENLIGDAMERAGKNVGKFISSQGYAGNIQIANNENQQLIRFPETLSATYDAFRNGRVYNMSKKERASIEKAFVSEIENDIDNAIIKEDLEIINTKLRYFEQYSEMQRNMKDVVNVLKASFNERVHSIIEE